jgi:hypothetical protein
MTDPDNCWDSAKLERSQVVEMPFERLIPPELGDAKKGYLALISAGLAACAFSLALAALARCFLFICLWLYFMVSPRFLT